jgi:hypothetical protein
VILANKSRYFVFTVCAVPLLLPAILMEPGKSTTFGALPMLPSIVWLDESFKILNKQIGHQFTDMYARFFLGAWVASIFFGVLIEFEVVENPHIVLGIIFGLIPVLLFCYMIWVVTRAYKIAQFKKDPDGLDLLPEVALFCIFPIGIWLYQPIIQKFFLDQKTKHAYGKNDARP